jgi:hypothetical protein
MKSPGVASDGNENLHGPYVEGQIAEWFPLAYSLPTYGS